VHVGDDVVIGEQGDERDRNRWGDRLGTISYEIVCGISAGALEYREDERSPTSRASAPGTGRTPSPDRMHGDPVPEGTVAPGEVRCGAPRREFDRCRERIVDRLMPSCPPVARHSGSPAADE
jgi:hypothetical protein